MTAASEPASRPLEGFRIGVTAARKADEQVALLRRRGAEVEWAAALSLEPNHVEVGELLAATKEVLAGPVDLFLATTGIGMRTWLDAAAEAGLYDDLVAALGHSEILARGPKSVGVLRRHGLRELWAPESECFEDVLAHLRGRDLTGKRIVVQEHGQSLSMSAHALRRQGAEVVTVPIYRVASADDPEPMFGLIDLIADCKLDAVTFTSAPAVAALMEAAFSVGRRDDVISAFQSDVVAACVGPVTAAAFEMWGVPTIVPERSRLAGLVKQLETELPTRRDGVDVRLADGRTLIVHTDSLLLDGVPVELSPAPASVLMALLVNPGHVVSRRALLAALPSGQAGSEHAVEMAVARLRAAIGTKAVLTVVKRGYRLAVG
ncbi:uroporphyrinogen-III synthase [Nocardioides astragali]|uniref:Uroporphyrinogen-III synthase n=1 Tax=Nocardioides astragali TaxID=1776736 RepID=A0ABW2MZD5_9ACTN|nr:uroporphyrinogen-III synthase [Nocardioides astragali]